MAAGQSTAYPVRFHSQYALLAWALHTTLLYHEFYSCNTTESDNNLIINITDFKFIVSKSLLI